MIKKISAILMAFCLSLSFVFFNVSHTSAADLGKPEITDYTTPKAGESMTVSWKPVTGACKYYIGIADVTDSPDRNDNYHHKIYTNSNIDGTSHTFKPEGGFVEKHTYKIAVGATADKNGLVVDEVISGNWSWAKPEFVYILPNDDDNPNLTPILEIAEVEFVYPSGDVYNVGYNVPICAKFYGDKIYRTEVTITLAGNSRPSHVIEPPIDNRSQINFTWDTIDCQEGEYEIKAFVYGERGNIIAEAKTSFALKMPNSAKINVLSPKPKESFLNIYETNSDIPIEANIEGYGYEYSKLTVYSPNNTIIDVSEKLSDPNISYTWRTMGHEAGIYSLLIQTYDSNNSELASRQINILLEEPKYADIVPDSENIKEYLVNDEVIYKARVEGSGYTYSKFFVRNKSNPADIVYSIPQEIHIGEDLKFLWDTTGAEPGEYDVWIEVYYLRDDYDKDILSKLEDTIILRELPSAKIVKFSAEDESTYSSNDIVSLEAEVEGSGYEYFRYIVNSENDEPVYDTDITRGEITPIQWNTAGCDAGDYRAFVIIYDANENVLDFSTTKITLTEAKKITYGDLDANGEVNAIDFAYIRKIVLGMISTAPSETWFEAADVDGDGEVNAIDFAHMRKYVLGIIDEFPIEKKYEYFEWQQ